MASRDGSVPGCVTTFNKKVDMADKRAIFDKLNAMTLADIARLPISIAAGMLTRLKSDVRRLFAILTLPDFILTLSDLKNAPQETEYAFRQELRDMM